MRKLGSLAGFCVLFSFVLAVSAPAPAGAWIYQKKLKHDQFVQSLAVDPAGSVIALKTRRIFLDDTCTVVKLHWLTGGEIWSRSFTMSNFVDRRRKAIAVDGAGDVYFTGSIDGHFKVVKLNGANGNILWQKLYISTSGEGDNGQVVVVDGNGDVLAAGTLGTDDGNNQNLTVIKLQGSDGTQLWSQQLPYGAFAGSVNYARDLVLDPSGEVIVSGETPGRITKLSAATGTVLWNTVYGGYGGNRFTRLAVDADGDVFGVGQVDLSGLNYFNLFKLSGATGVELWKRPMTEGFTSLGLTSSGDVIAAGDGSHSNLVLKLDGDDGGFIWQNVQTSGDHPIAWDVVVDTTTDDAYVTGRLGNVFDVHKIAANGISLWARTLDGTAAQDQDVTPGADNDDVGNVAVLRPSGGVFVGGLLDNTLTKQDAVVYALRSNGQSVSIQIMLFFSMSEAASGVWSLNVTAELSAAAPSPRQTGDPTAEGAQLELQNPTTREFAVIDLPADLWRASTTRGGGVKGYEYVDRDGVAGPCRKVVLRPSGKLIASCRVSGRVHPFTLDEAQQGSFDLKLRLGGGDVYCWSTAGGEVVADAGLIAPRRRGTFKVKNAPAPAMCE